MASWVGKIPQKMAATPVVPLENPPDGRAWWATVRDAKMVYDCDTDMTSSFPLELKSDYSSQ